MLLKWKQKHFSPCKFLPRLGQSLNEERKKQKRRSNLSALHKIEAETHLWNRKKNTTFVRGSNKNFFEKQWNGSVHKIETKICRTVKHIITWIASVIQLQKMKERKPLRILNMRSFSYVSG